MKDITVDVRLHEVGGPRSRFRCPLHHALTQWVAGVYALLLWARRTRSGAVAARHDLRLALAAAAAPDGKADARPGHAVCRHLRPRTLAPHAPLLHTMRAHPCSIRLRNCSSRPRSRSSWSPTGRALTASALFSPRSVPPSARTSSRRRPTRPLPWSWSASACGSTTARAAGRAGPVPACRCRPSRTRRSTAPP